MNQSWLISNIIGLTHLAESFMFSLRAFLRLEVERLKTGISWFEAKRRIIRHAIRLYIKYPSYLLFGRAVHRSKAM